MSDGTPPEAGTRFGPYLLRRILGRGGMGTVYEAEDTAMDRVVALKLISGSYAQDKDYRQRLQREARIAGRLQDPHVVPIHSTGEIDGHLYVDMRLINGTDLETVLKQSGPLQPAKAVAVVRQIASALDAAHAAGVLHRDVKPGNILITSDDFAYLVDFGIANAATEQKLTQMGDVLGTWTYMAPERFRGDPAEVTASADTYALACVLFEALTGKPPFTGDTATLVGAHLTEPVPRVSSRLGLPPGLDDVIARGMAKRPEDRYATTGDFARAAEGALAALGGTTETFTVPAGPAPTALAPTMQARPEQQTPPPQWTQPTPAYVPPPSTPPSSTPPPGTWPQPSPTPWPQPAPPSKKGRRWIPIAAAVFLVVALAAAFGIWQLTSGGDKPAQKNAVDPSTLDVGKYGTKPRPLPGPTTPEEGKFLDAFRLAEGIVDPYEVDPVLDHVYGNASPDPANAAATISGTGTPLTQPVLEKYGMVSAYIVQGVSKRIADFIREKSGDVLLIMLTSFPNEDAAAKAAAEMDAVDFAVNNENRGVQIPGYSQARAHYRPGSPSVGATMASGTLVASIIARSDENPNVTYLTQQVKKTLDLQTPLMAKLIPVGAVGLTSLPLDPDHMLSRLFVSGDQPKVSADFGSMGPRAAMLCADSQPRKDGLYAQAGIDRCAFSTDGQLMRTKDEAAAKTFLPKQIESERAEYIDHDLASPDRLPSARCVEQKAQIVTDNANGRFVCFVQFGRYVAAVWSNEEKDAQQRAAAQYAILFNSA
ncbi:MAG: serine/threonine kinase PknH [Mycobacterium sp.]|nr:serine/threonine kinase PknH [Mycobacterium sp.]